MPTSDPNMVHANCAKCSQTIYTHKDNLRAPYYCLACKWVMDKLESSYSKFMGYKVACTQCDQLYIKPDDEPFVCLSCLSDR